MMNGSQPKTAFRSADCGEASGNTANEFNTEEDNRMSTPTSGPATPLVFGPVPSRRLGRSLGINNVPPKTCTYACVYCQVGPSPAKEVTPRSFHFPAEIAEAVATRVGNLEATGEPIDYLTFVPDGEPTLDVGLAEEIELLRPLGINIAVITNATLLWREDVRATLGRADWVSVKVDAADEATWRHINHPHEALELDRVLEGIAVFSQEYAGDLTTETMLASGINDSAESLRKVADFIAGLDITTSYLSVPTRPPAVRGVRPPSVTVLNGGYQVLSRRLDRVELLIGYEGDEFTSTGDVANDMLSICAVHPMRRSAVEQLLTQSGGGWTTVDSLLAEGQLIEVEFEGHDYFLRPLALR
jgi:wyosine [tRNA(Phe)-imidazoG37] synthetase (radical SAM superfamily)